VYVFSKEYFHPFNPNPLKFKPLVLVGPSGVGKSTLVDEVLIKYGDIFERKISYTTR
jgi:guanylate kinase